MKHFTTPDFWEYYQKLSPSVQKLADRSFTLLKENSQHPSLHLKKVGKFWSVRIGIRHRALAVEHKNGLV